MNSSDITPRPRDPMLDFIMVPDPEPFPLDTQAPVPVPQVLSGLPDFVAFDPIPRLNRDIVITEKIDGMNMCLWFQTEQEFIVSGFKGINIGQYVTFPDGSRGFMMVQSRNQYVTPANDVKGFATWAFAYKDTLARLGAGRHWGEWWGSGVRTHYGLTNGEKRFSLFNVGRWNVDNIPGIVHVVPTLYSGVFDPEAIRCTLRDLRAMGSFATGRYRANGATSFLPVWDVNEDVPMFPKPEGIVIYHTAAKQYFKVTLLNDEKPKSQVSE
jgi:hypothetical protein